MILFVILPSCHSEVIPLVLPKNTNFSFADLLKIIHNVRSHFFILEFVGGNFHVSAQLCNFNVLKQCFDHIKQGKFEFNFYSFYDSCVLSHNWQIYIYFFWFPCSNFSFHWQIFFEILTFCTMFFYHQKKKKKKRVGIGLIFLLWSQKICPLFRICTRDICAATFYVTFSTEKFQYKYHCKHTCFII